MEQAKQVMANSRWKGCKGWSMEGWRISENKFNILNFFSWVGFWIGNNGWFKAVDMKENT